MMPTFRNSANAITSSRFIACTDKARRNLESHADKTFMTTFFLRKNFAPVLKYIGVIDDGVPSVGKPT